MIGVIVELLLSWLLLYYIEHQGLSVLGFRPTRRRSILFGLGLLLTAGYVTGFYLVESVLLRSPYHANPAYGFRDLLPATWHVITSVLFEELLFRGALLYILIRRIGPSRAVLLSAVAFGCYHWFTTGFGNPKQMIQVFLITGFAGYAFARAYAKTGTLLLPFALHFALNFTAMVIFSHNYGAGNQLLVPALSPDAIKPAPWLSLGLFAVYSFGYPLAVLVWLRAVKPSPPAAEPVNINKLVI